MAEDQDAEDFRVFIQAFKPVRGKIDVYVKAAHATDSLEGQVWSPLKLVETELYSETTNRDDIKEYTYVLYTRDEMNATQYANVFVDTTSSDYTYRYTEGRVKEGILATNNSTGVAEYTLNNSTYSTYKTFQIKIVTYAEQQASTGYGTRNAANPPIIHDIRGVALQT